MIVTVSARCERRPARQPPRGRVTPTRHAYCVPGPGPSHAPGPPSGPPRRLGTPRACRPYIRAPPPRHPRPTAGSASRRLLYPGRFAAGRLGRRHSLAYALRRPIPLWTTSPGMWTARPLKVFSTHRPWTASVQVAGAVHANR